VGFFPNRRDCCPEQFGVLSSCSPKKVVKDAFNAWRLAAIVLMQAEDPPERLREFLRELD
jgi:hypothetical protein